ncbi:MAG: ankyrin repeat domain-containing protein [Blastocatellia bacterium]
MSKKSFEQRLKVLSPCSAEWGKMVGNNQVRFCEHCSKSVNNISEMTREQALELVLKSNGRLCVRYYKTSDQKIKSQPSTSDFKLNPSPLLKFAAGVLLTTALSASPAIAQTMLPTGNNVAVETKLNNPNLPDPIWEGGYASLTGTVTDEQGAVIPGASVTLTGVASSYKKTTFTNENGEFYFDSLPEQGYSICSTADGFKVSEANIFIKETKNTLYLALAVDESTEFVTVGDVAVLSPAEEMLSYYEERRQIDDSQETLPEITEDVEEFFSAVINENFKKAKTLLNKGVNINSTNIYGETALMFAVRDKKMLKFLLKYGANASIASRFGTTALMHAAVYGDIEIVKMLISSGAYVNATDINGRSALLFAVVDGRDEIVNQLLLSGADTNLKDSTGSTAACYAKAGDHKKVKKLLKAIGAE